MTTERATPPAGFDTHAEVRKLEEAGVPAEHGVAMLYAAIAAADARNAELREETERRHDELRRDNADLRKGTKRSNAQLRKDMKRDIKIAQWKTIAGVSIALLAASGVIVAGVKFVLEWPLG